MSVPARINAVNRLLPRGFTRTRLDSVDAIEDAARTSTGIDTDLSADHRQAIAALLRSYAASADLHPLGVIITAANLVALTKNRLRLKQHVVANPHITRQTLDAPLIITGLPRTGSTLLHNLLALDPQFRVPTSWEVDYPLPKPETALGRWVKIARSQARFAAIEALHPGFRRIHELDALLPQECLVITAAAARSHLFFSSTFVPDYQDWLDEQPAAPMFRGHKQLLQHLQHADGSNHIWALKAPSHLFALDGLFETYPNCRLVQTRRAPEEVVASIASLQWHLYRTFSNFNDLAELGRQVCNRWGRAHQAFEQRLSESPERREQTYSLDYAQFVAGPVAAIAKLYAHFELQLSGDVRTKMENYLSARPKGKFGKHEYQLADYGLTPNKVSTAFGI